MNHTVIQNSWQLMQELKKWLSENIEPSASTFAYHGKTMQWQMTIDSKVHLLIIHKDYEQIKLLLHIKYGGEKLKIYNK